MMSDFVVLSAAAVRHCIATEVIADAPVAGRLGEILLRPHQLRAAVRVLSIMGAHGGAMLAEPVGVGKTYTALAVAARIGGPILVIAPAVLREMWCGAAQRCALAITFTSHESLSRG